MRSLRAWSMVALAVVALSACQKAPAPAMTAPRLGSAAALSAPQGARGFGPLAGSFTRSAQADLYPVTAGSRWTYVLHQRQADGSEQDRPMTIAITRAETRPDGVVEAVTERQYQNWSPPATRVLRHPDKVVLSRLSDPEDGPSITVLKTPFVPGAEWPGRLLGGGHSETIRAVGQEEVSVPAGRFTAYRVDHLIRYATGGTDTLNYWYAPGVGVVKMIERTTLYQDGKPLHLQVVGELETYVIGAGALKSRGSAAK